MALQLMKDVGIPNDEEHINDYPHQWSGGMLHRAVIAIALAEDPEILIADEPITALDVTIQAQILRLMKKIQEERDSSIIFINHDLGVVAQVCDKVAIMYAGEIVETGDLDAIYDNAKHPYTIGLFGSIPDLDNDTERLSPIAGLMPDPTALPDGCSFSPRCPHCTQYCKDHDPALEEIDPGHSVKCWLYSQQREVEE